MSNLKSLPPYSSRQRGIRCAIALWCCTSSCSVFATYRRQPTRSLELLMFFSAIVITVLLVLITGLASTWYLTGSGDRCIDGTLEGIEENGHSRANSHTTSMPSSVPSTITSTLQGVHCTAVSWNTVSRMRALSFPFRVFDSRYSERYGRVSRTKSSPGSIHRNIGGKL
jgi:hypothetical protein